MPQAQTQSNDDEFMQIGGNAGARLKSFVERIENIEEEESHLREDKKEVYSEAKGVGFDTKILRKVIKRRKMEREKREEEDQLVELYEDTIDKQLKDMME